VAEMTCSDSLMMRAAACGVEGGQGGLAAGHAGAGVEVLVPMQLREDVKEHIRAAMRRYA
jgi:hypothetical protein